MRKYLGTYLSSINEYLQTQIHQKNLDLNYCIQNHLMRAVMFEPKIQTYKFQISAPTLLVHFNASYLVSKRYEKLSSIMKIKQK